MNRRTFLRLSGAGVATCGLPTGPAIGAVRASGSGSGQPDASPPEVVVVGAGAFGGWTALSLREMGISVALVDAYGPGNARASSGGETRQIRASYGDREHYSRWAIAALERWKAREAEWGRRLLFGTGQITFSPRWTDELAATKAVLDRLGVANEVLQRDALVREYPQFNLDGIEVGHFVPSTGVLKAREACLAVAEAFGAKGGRSVLGKATPGRRAGGRLQDVTLAAGGTLSAQTFVFACGPWHTKIFPEVFERKLRVVRRVVFFVGSPDDDHRLSLGRSPAFTIPGAYGFPDLDGRGVKIAPYWSSATLDPDTGDRVATPAEIARAHQYLPTVCPSLRGQPILETRVCPRTNSVDSHFIVDRHPELENVWLVAGGSGHGFKHGPMMGEYVARRVTGRSTATEVDAMFRLKDETFGAGAEGA